MDHFSYRDGQLHAEEVPLATIAQRWGTPSFVYSRATLEHHYRRFDEALAGLDHRVCYAVKANSNLAVLDVLARLGASFDIVSGGELGRLQHLQVPGERIVFSGVGKTREEMADALAYGVLSINVESESELVRLQEVAHAHGVSAPVALRINPDVDPKTHPYISTGLKNNKFGIAMDRARSVYAQAAAQSHLQIIGIDCHIGSQLIDLAPYEAALERVLLLREGLLSDGLHVPHLDLGGGLGIRYRDEQPPSPQAWGDILRRMLTGLEVEVLIEPGRAIAGNAGVLLTRVEYLKPGAHRNFAIVDAAMTELMRPALYDAWHDIWPVLPRDGTMPSTWDIVGPVCESGDWLGKDRALALQEGDLLAIRSAGAYAAVMGSHYNSRGRACELLVDGDQVHVARAREPAADIWRLEQPLAPATRAGETR